jgi:hypothetical protein
MSMPSSLMGLSGEIINHVGHHLLPPQKAYTSFRMFLHTKSEWHGRKTPMIVSMLGMFANEPTA